MAVDLKKQLQQVSKEIKALSKKVDKLVVAAGKAAAPKKAAAKKPAAKKTTAKKTATKKTATKKAEKKKSLAKEVAAKLREHYGADDIDRAMGNYLRWMRVPKEWTVIEEGLELGETIVINDQDGFVVIHCIHEIPIPYFG